MVAIWCELPGQVGARVHSDSWGSSALDYDYMASEVDLFTWDHQVGLTWTPAGTLARQLQQPGNTNPCSA